MLVGLPMPVPDAAAFSSTPALARTLRWGLACSVGLPLEHVQLDSVTDSAGRTARFGAAANGGSGACDSRRCRRLAGAALGDTADSALDSAAAAAAAAPSPRHSAARAPRLLVPSIARLGPGRAVWLHDAVAATAAQGAARSVQAGRSLQAGGSGVSARLLIPALAAHGASVGDVVAAQQGIAARLVSALVDSVAPSGEAAAAGGSSPLLDSLSSAGFLDAYSAATGVNPVDLAAALSAVSQPTVDVPSVTGTASRSRSATGATSQSPSAVVTDRAPNATVGGAGSGGGGSPGPPGEAAAGDRAITGVIVGAALGAAALAAGAIAIAAALVLRRRRHAASAVAVAAAAAAAAAAASKQPPQQTAAGSECPDGARPAEAAGLGTGAGEEACQDPE